MATDEARCTSFTRAAMSAARCIKLIHMMGLHRLDDPQAEFEMAPTLVPPKDWAELEGLSAFVLSFFRRKERKRPSADKDI